MLTMTTAAARLSGFPPKVHGVKSHGVMSHIVQTLGPALLRQQINRSGVELEPFSTLTSKHHHLFMRLLVNYKTSRASGGCTVYSGIFVLIKTAPCIHGVYTQKMEA